MRDIVKIDLELVKEIEWTGDPEQYDLDLQSLGAEHDEFLVVNPWIEDPDLYCLINDIPETDKCVVWKIKDQWVAKYFISSWNPEQGYEEIELKRPAFTWRKNPDLDRTMTFEDDPFGEYQPGSWESQHELVWYIDPRFNPLEDKVWAIKAKPIGRPTVGVKEMGYVIPKVNIEFNTELADLGLDVDELCPPYWDLASECAYQLDSVHTPDEQIWIVKFRPAYRKPQSLKWIGVITPDIKITHNKQLPNLSYDVEYTIPWHDLAYEHVWMLDHKHNDDSGKEIWAFKLTATTKPKKTITVDYVTPLLEYETNSDLADVNYNIDYSIPWHDLAYEHVWMLDPKHCYTAPEAVWAMKARAVDRVKGSKIIGNVSPGYKVEINSSLAGSEFSDYKNYSIQYHDFGFSHVWMLDKESSADLDIWAVKLDLVDEPDGYKEVGYISADSRIVYNTDIENLEFKIDYVVPYHDRKYVHVWYLDPRYSNGERIWAAKLFPTTTAKGEKDMGLIVPDLPAQLDVVFISYNELNAEENWQRVLEKAPQAKRIHGVVGILEAHKEAAKIVSTDMFYVVDGDAYLTDDWTFDFQPSIFDRDCVYVWNSQNPLIPASYGYGGVKLFPTKIVKNAVKWGTDITTSIADKFQLQEGISNITQFNTDEYSTWRSAFRECAKLSKSKDPDAKRKLKQWLIATGEFDTWARLGAEQGIEYAKKNKTVRQVNDYTWLAEQFKELNGRR